MGRTIYDDVAASDAADRRRFDDHDSRPISIADRHWPRPADVAEQLAEDWRHDLRTGQLEDDDRALERDGAEGVEVYSCRFCDGFHLGHGGAS